MVTVESRRLQNLRSKSNVSAVGVWQGYINIMWAVGGSAGAPLGGIFADTIGWRW